MIGALSNLWLGDRLGRRKTIVLGGASGWLLPYPPRLSHIEDMCFLLIRYYHGHRRDPADHVRQLCDASRGSYHYWSRKRSQCITFSANALVIVPQSILHRLLQYLHTMLNALTPVGVEHISWLLEALSLLESCYRAYLLPVQVTCGPSLTLLLFNQIR